MVSIAIAPAPGSEPAKNELSIDISQKTEQPGAGIIKNSPFWPDVDLTLYRASMRQDGTISQPRVVETAHNAIKEVNDRLSGFRRQQESAGYSNLADVPAEEIDNESVRVQLYRRAVFYLIQASVTEKYPTVDATGAGTKRAEALDPTIDDLRRDAAWAINDLQALPRTTIELI